MARISFQKLENEPEWAFKCFEAYRDLGRGRSLRKAYRHFLAQKAERSPIRGRGRPRSAILAHADDLSHRPSVRSDMLPGYWGRLSRRFSWAARAASYDLDRLTSGALKGLFAQFQALHEQER